MVAGMGAGSVCFAQEPAEPPAPAQAAEPPPAAGQAALDAELATEVQQLRSDVDQLKNQLAQLNSVIEQLQASQSTPTKIPPAPRAKRTTPATTKKAPAPANPPAAAAETDLPLTVLVFQDGHRIEARNYAIVGQTLWIYTEDDSKKMPLSELDVAATKSANSDRGIVFQVPPTR